MTEECDHKCKRAKMRFLRKIKGVTMFVKLRNTAIREPLNIKSLLLRIKKSQLRWFGHVSRMLQERLPKQTFYTNMSGKRPIKRPRTRWLDYIEDDLGWNRLGLCPSEMQFVLMDREVWLLNLELLPPQPQEKSDEQKKKKIVIKKSSKC